MVDMRSSTCVSLLLLAAVSAALLTVPQTNGQSAATTTTMTIPQLQLGQCSYISIPFMARKGMVIVGTFGSDAMVSFYILSQEDFNAIQNPDCRLPSTATPVYSQQYSVGHDNPYRTLLFPADGTYYFVFVYHNNGPSQLVSGHATVELAYPDNLTLVSSATSITSSSSNVLSITAQNTTVTTSKISNVTVVSQNSTSSSSPTLLGFNETVGIIVVIALVASVIVFMKRKSLVSTTSRHFPGEGNGAQKLELLVPSPKQTISTGYAELDAVLAGGLPTGRSILIESPPCDERDLLLRKIIASGLSMGGSVFFLSRDVGRIQDLASMYRHKFYAFTPQIDNVTANTGNIFRILGVQNLVELNISFMKAIEPLLEGNSIKVMIVDFLSDVLLEHKSLTTRKWLDEFIARHKTEGFTLIATLNPLITTKQETQTIVDLFDGIIEIYEKELRERARRFLTVKKMYGVRYVETELLLDKDKLF